MKLFKPRGIPSSKMEILEIELDEFEAMRLCDIEGKNQIEASEIMEISRGTVQRLLASGRKKVMEGLLYDKGLLIKSEL
jgi:predicted DNA-binding protein (UPF0251 family)